MSTPAAPLTCPRCGRRSAPDSGPFCPHCGRYLAPLRWVAETPSSATPPPLPRPRRRYVGAPRYPFLPRWGFAPGPWRTADPAPPAADAVRATRTSLGTLVPLLWATAVVALVAAGAEVWRYLLLLASRSDALSAGVVAASDALVAAAGWVAPISAALAGLVLVQWTVRATQAAADRAGVRPARSPRWLALGWLVPGLNLSMPGSALAEIEHAALDRPAEQRPRPTRLLLGWWALWVAGLVLAAIVLAWSLRTGVQARADGVVLHAVLDVLAAVTAGVTAVLVTRLTRLLSPPRYRRRELVVAVPAEPGSSTTGWRRRRDREAAEAAHDEVRPADRVGGELEAGQPAGQRP